MVNPRGSEKGTGKVKKSVKALQPELVDEVEVKDSVDKVKKGRSHSIVIVPPAGNKRNTIYL